MCHWGLLVISATVAVAAYNDANQLQTDEIIEAVNNAKTTWKAGRNFHPSLKKGYLKNLLGVNKRSTPSSLQALTKISEFEREDFPDLPPYFDAREKWKSCVSLQEVRDQGSCGSCWAVSTVSTFTDRLCIATNGSFNGHLSVQHLLTCCSKCGSGCGGGNPESAWLFFQEFGIVSGGDYDSKEGCQPYTFPTCEHYVSGPRGICRDDYDNITTPECKKECYNNEYKANGLKEEIHTVKMTFSVSLFAFEPKYQILAMKIIQNEIYTNGPLTTCFAVYEDFLAYKTGVYQYTTGNYVYGHAVKVIGWGEEEGVPYWLVANSWNSDWGDNGFFKIRRGSNECGFEKEFLGGVPNI